MPATNDTATASVADAAKTLLTRRRQLARGAAVVICEAFDAYHENFRAITRRAMGHFERREWQQAQADALERLDLHAQLVRSVVDGLGVLLGAQATDCELWLSIKRGYADLIAHRTDLEIAETFFNSVVRRVHTVVGVDPALEFVWFGVTQLPSGNEASSYRLYVRLHTTQAVVEAILSDYSFAVPYADLAGDAAQAARKLDARLLAAWDRVEFDCIHMLKSVFYRNKGAYLIGRIRRRNRILPILIPLVQDGCGIIVDTVLLSEVEASLVFSLPRSYFHVEADHPAELAGFLKSIMPLKPTAELYTSIGFNKHGKTVLFRDLYRRLANANDKFELARGSKGMVMIVFSLASFDIVFKVIKDNFADPKTSNRQEVMERYRFVFRHDRVGRMVDAQEFENLTFNREHFAPDLLDELLDVAPSTVVLRGDEVVIRHVYTERRLYPLDLYIKEMGLEKASAAVVDYGRAIGELASANIFPGDLFTKNFGVTRQGRVVFYDYDEVCRLDECTFRHLPVAATYEEEISSEPWFAVGRGDIFPEEFRTFLRLPKPFMAVLEQSHGEIFTVEFWQEMQARAQAGEIVDIFPYDPEVRFHSDSDV